MLWNEIMMYLVYSFEEYNSEFRFDKNKHVSENLI